MRHTLLRGGVVVCAFMLGLFGMTTIVLAQTDTTAPDTFIIVAPPFSFNSSAVSFAFIGSEAATFSCSLDGFSFNACPSSYNVTGLARGTHTLRVRATDLSGNTDQFPASFTFAVGEALATPADEGTGGPPEPPFALSEMEADADVVASADHNRVVVALGGEPCEWSESTAAAKIDSQFGIISDARGRNAVVNFVACGTFSTLHLGAGERMGVVGSYHAAYGRFPGTSVQSWFDVMKIANGRFPGETSGSAEGSARARFRTIYLHDAFMANARELAAVKIMAYGLRPLPRNLGAEVKAIAIFKGLFGVSPTGQTDWDIVRALAYSGVAR